MGSIQNPGRITMKRSEKVYVLCCVFLMFATAFASGVFARAAIENGEYCLGGLLALAALAASIFFGREAIIETRLFRGRILCIKDRCDQ